MPISYIATICHNMLSGLHNHYHSGAQVPVPNSLVLLVITCNANEHKIILDWLLVLIQKI